MAIKINGTEVIDDARNIVNVGNIDGRDVSADGAKLDNVEASADVTDSANVASALTGLNTETSIAGTDLIPVYDGSASQWRKSTITDAALQGVKGQKGQVGDDGSDGSNGNKGQKGERGLTGDQGQKGEVGNQGIEGDDGDKGQKGEIGDKGQKGQTGGEGDKGQKGQTGLTGNDGDKGQKGEIGAAGADGSNGGIGLTGETGDKGQKGEIGNTGGGGQKGQTGDKGQKGQTGATGDTGGQGIQGDDGDKGQKGQNGDKGQKGEIGDKGQKGQTGNTGGQGIQGNTGLQGDGGQKGQKGQTGNNGSDGDKGQKGQTGAGGGDGDKGQKGQTGDTGPAGGSGGTGATGEKGQKGDEAGNAGLLDGYDSSRFMRRQSKKTATVGPGWMTVATNTSNRVHGEVVVTDGDSGDHSFIRIDYMRSYNDANFTVINTGGHQNRITGARILYQTSSNTYGIKILQVYVTASSNYEVNIYEHGDITDYGVPSGVTPVIENTKTGYAVHGNQIENLETYSLSAEEGVQSGSNMRFGGSLYAGSTQIVNSSGEWVGSDSGIKGQKGENGQKGQKGEIGAGGDDGDKGQKGQTGQKGQKGDKGQKGQTGNTGGDGDQGQKGQTGNTGGTGAKGQKGQTGSTGTTGATGSTGAKGQKGEKGQTGSTGATGLIDSPYGAIAAYGSGAQSNITWSNSEQAMVLQSSTDTSIGAAFPAFRVNLSSSETHKLSIKYKSNGSYSNGFYARIYEYNAALPNGKLAVSNSANNSLVQEDTSGFTNWKENGSVASTWKTTDYTYTPSSGAVWASIVVLNWTGIGTNPLYIRDPEHQLIGSSGQKGQKGQTGGTGSTGQKGQKGQTGGTGSTGSTGSTGAKGQKGQKGQTGGTGSTGGTGAKGQKGESAVTATSVTFGSGVTLQESTDRADLLQITSATSGYGGLQIRNSSNEGRWSFMTDGQTAGFYDDENSDWAVQMVENGGVTLYHNGVANFTTGATYMEMARHLDMNNYDIRGVDQIFHHGDTNTYMQFPASDQWRVVTGGTERLKITNDNIFMAQDVLMGGNDIDMNDGRLLDVEDIYLHDAIYHDGDTNTYMQFHAADSWRVVTSATPRLTVTNSQITSAEPIHAPSFHGDGSALTNIPGPSTTAGAVGTYAYLIATTSSIGITPGSTYAGSGLRYSAQSSNSITSSSGYSVGHNQGTAPAGTWRAMGGRTTTATYKYAATLYVRIS